MAKRLYVVGLGPGDPRYFTGQARAALEDAQVLCGYTVYVELIRGLYPDKETYTTPMTREIDRCRWALEAAEGGRTGRAQNPDRNPGKNRAKTGQKIRPRSRSRISCYFL